MGVNSMPLLDSRRGFDYVNAMQISHFARRHRKLWQLVLTFMNVLAALSVAVYVNLATNTKDPWSVGWPGARCYWLVLAGALIVAQVYLASAHHSSRASIRDQIHALLEITIRALLHPKPLEDFVVRAQCRRANSATETLEVFAEFSHPPHWESPNPVHYNGPDKDILVVSKSFRNGQILAENLKPKWHDGLTPDNQWIRQQIRCVLAAPIKDAKDPASAPIGTISFDSSKPLKETRFDSPEGKTLAELVAGAIFELLVMFDELDETR